MSDTEYSVVQQQIMMLAGMVRGMDLSGFLDRIAHAEAIGPILDPTLYRAGMEQLQQVRRLAESLRGFQKVIAEVEKVIKA